ncbi:MAG: DUF2207 domain-containing protein [Acidobacteriia bacterium]|nr:DUF2207 domain-containing protein [Terriglobia bacterium]
MREATSNAYAVAPGASPGLCGGLTRPSRRTWCFLLALAFFVCLATPALARNWRIADFHSTVAIDDHGGATITEHITLVFVGQYNGIWRSIPVEYPGPGGTNYSLFLKVEAVTDENERPLKYEVSRDGPNKKIKIYIPGALNTTKTVLVTYSSPNALRYFDDHDEFYWNVTGNDWPVPIDHASALVSLPDSAAGGLRAQAFTGFYGSTSHEATADVKGSHVEFETTNPLPMRGGLTVDVYIPKGILHQPGLLTRLGWFLRSNPAVFLPFWSLLVMFTLWYYKGRDPDPGRSVAPMYEPPKDMTPAEAGTLLDDSLDPRDITSTIVDLAVRGYLKIEQVEIPGFFHHGKDYVFHLLKPNSQWSELAPFERVMLENIFWGGTKTDLSSLRNRFYTAIPVIKQDIFSALKRKGMYWLDPESAAGYSLLGAIVCAAPFALGQFTGVMSLFDSPLLAVISIVISLVIVWLFARQMTCKTVLGARTRVEVLGFQEFMDRVDRDRIARMPPDTFEKYLPYAMALGVEHNWAQAFAGIVQQPPSWYAGPGGSGMFNPVLFSSNMHTMAQTAHETFVAAPRASSSGSGWGGGGGGGGGFSGGGGGGGGGGAF